MWLEAKIDGTRTNLLNCMHCTQRYSGWGGNLCSLPSPGFLTSSDPLSSSWYPIQVIEYRVRLQSCGYTASRLVVLFSKLPKVCHAWICWWSHDILCWACNGRDAGRTRIRRFPYQSILLLIGPHEHPPSRLTTAFFVFKNVALQVTKWILPWPLVCVRREQP